MPPEVSSFHPTVKPLIQSLTHHSLSHRYCRGGAKKRMLITKKKLFPILIFALSGISILRLLKITTVTPFSSPATTSAVVATTSHSRLDPYPDAASKNLSSQTPGPSKRHPSSSGAPLTDKEHQLLSNIISRKAPCNLLVFGLEPQYHNLSAINAGGTTIFLEDNPEKLAAVKENQSRTQIYRVEYHTLARDAYKLLREGRENPSCAFSSGSLKKSGCPLTLKKLPNKVYKWRWDVVVVDGPAGNSPHSPGRMAAIYTAAVIARAGNGTEVVVHDVDRMIEKWFSWEFLCDENLVSSKGKLWNFRIPGKLNWTEFCPAKKTAIQK
ncbi:Glucuronoxylan 4-O-methyltransferase [Bertholletia excelsa]